MFGISGGKCLKQGLFLDISATLLILFTTSTRSFLFKIQHLFISFFIICKLQKARSIRENRVFLSFNIIFCLKKNLCQCVQNAYTVRKMNQAS